MSTKPRPSQVDRLLDQGEEAARSREWDDARRLAFEVLRLDGSGAQSPRTMQLLARANAGTAEDVRVDVAQTRGLATLDAPEAFALLHAGYGSEIRAKALLDYWPLIACSARRVVLTEIWTGLDWTWRFWRGLRELFRETGYLGERPRPRKAVILYRGVSNRGHRRGLSWTVSRGTAQGFATTLRQALTTGGDVGYLYQVAAPPEAIMARFDDRDEAEYVLDPDLYPRVKLVKELPIVGRS